jgi:poly-gamma-glutamate synthesis protein (capsule biosynthesis protein)
MRWVFLLIAAVSVHAQTLRVVVTGQSLIRSDLRKTAPAAVEQARKYLADSDVRFTNLEAAVAPREAAVTPLPGAERTDPAVLDCLKEMGFNLLSLSNNHAMDLGEAGLRATRDEVARRGFGYTGTGPNLAAALTPGFAGKVALIGMASAGGQLTPDTWATADRAGVNFLELRKDGKLNPEHAARILQAVRDAARGSSGVIVYHHNHYWGDSQGSALPPGRVPVISRFDTPRWQIEWAHQLIDAGALMYVAHGDPSLHGVEIYKGRPIFYSLGNYIFQSANPIDVYGPLAYMSVVAKAEFRNGSVAALSFQPIVLSLDSSAQAPRGAPFLAEGGEAQTILHRLADVSRPYGTEIKIEGNKASLSIPTHP